MNLLTPCLSWLLVLLSASAGKWDGPHIPPARSSATFRRALAMTKAGNYTGGIPLFEQALASTAEAATQCEMRLAFAGCLYGASFKVVDRLGVPGPEHSVSVERIALLRRATEQLDRAELAVTSTRTLAAIRFDHGMILEAWGFPLDAYGWYRAASNADPDCLDAVNGLLRTSALLRGSDR